MTAPATTVVRVPERGRDSRGPFVAFVALCLCGVIAWRVTQPVTVIVPDRPIGSSALAISPSGPTAPAGPPVVIAITETPPPTATRKPWPTPTPFPKCEPGKATPGVICRVPLPPIVPQTETPIPRCPMPPASPAPGTMCIWQGGSE